MKHAKISEEVDCPPFQRHFAVFVRLIFLRGGGREFVTVELQICFYTFFWKDLKV